MFIALRDLAIQPIVVSVVLKPGVVDLRSTDFRQKGALTVEAVVSLVSEEVRVQGQLEGCVETTCSRCLEAVEIPVKKSFDLFYRSQKSLVPTGGDEEIELKPADLEVGFFSGGGLELTDALREQILIEMPMKPICRPECKGLCPLCGANLNASPCHCERQENDPRWAILNLMKER